MSNPALDQLKKNKQTLEYRLSGLLAQEIGAFAKENGVWPKYMSVSLLPIYQMGSPINEPIYCHTSVSLEIPV